MSDELHEPTFDDTTAERWEEPSRQEFDDSGVESVEDHFLLSASGFPPDSDDDLELPVVDADGQLNRNALANAAYGPGSVERLDVSEEVEAETKDLIHDLLEQEFDSLPQTMNREEQRDRMLAWRAEQEGDRHEAEQKLHTDDEARELDVDEQRDETQEERPEKGR